MIVNALMRKMSMARPMSQFVVKHQAADYILQPEKHKYTMIFLHGIGSYAEKWVSFFTLEPSIVNKATTKVVLLQSAKRYTPYKNYGIIPLWYEFKVRTGCEEDPNMLELGQAIHYVRSHVEKEAAILNHDYSRLILCGFSQGGMLGLSLVSQFDKKIGGAIALSTMLVESTKFEPEKREYPPIFLYHGKADKEITYEHSQLMYQPLLSKADKINVTMISEEGLGHTISQEEIHRIRAFVDSIFND